LPGLYLTMWGRKGRSTVGVIPFNADAVTDFPAGNAASDLGDLPRHVEADHDGERHLDPGHAVHREHVVIVERGGPHADHYVPVIRRRRGIVVYDFELIEAAMPAQEKGFHGLAGAPAQSARSPH